MACGQRTPVRKSIGIDRVAAEDNRPLAGPTQVMIAASAPELAERASSAFPKRPQCNLTSRV